MNKKRENFEKIATRRVEAILKNLDLLSNCSNKYTYEYTKEDTAKIFKAISSKINLCKSSFDKKLTQSNFKL
jgi:hypothetical protein